jgi:hypothetical protein
MLITSNKFLGWAQYTKEEFDKLLITEKAGRLNFVRTFDENNTPIHSSIYFGTRLYAEVNDNSLLEKKITNIITSLGSCVSENGEFKEFEIEQHEILSGATDITTALIILETSIISISDGLKELKNEVNELKSEVKELENMHIIEGDDIN